jgi:hypothetical protein
MRKIYEGSSNLIIWLGPESDESAEAIEMMKELARASSEGKSQEWRQCFEGHPEYLRRWISIACFFSRAWFTRVWIIQEYTASSQMKELSSPF